MPLLSVFVACIGVLGCSAQSLTNIGVQNLTVEARSCARFRLGTGQPEQAAYQVVTFPLLTVRTADPNYSLETYVVVFLIYFVQRTEHCTCAWNLNGHCIVRMDAAYLPQTARYTDTPQSIAYWPGSGMVA